MKETVEMGWTARDSSNVKSFAVLHGGAYPLKLSVKLEVSNYRKEILNINNNYNVNPYAQKFLFHNLSQIK